MHCRKVQHSGQWPVYTLIGQTCLQIPRTTVKCIKKANFSFAIHTRQTWKLHGLLKHYSQIWHLLYKKWSVQWNKCVTCWIRKTTEKGLLCVRLPMQGTQNRGSDHSIHVIFLPGKFWRSIQVIWGQHRCHLKMLDQRMVNISRYDHCTLYRQ